MVIVVPSCLVNTKLFPDFEALTNPLIVSPEPSPTEPTFCQLPLSYLI